MSHLFACLSICMFIHSFMHAYIHSLNHSLFHHTVFPSIRHLQVWVAAFMMFCSGNLHTNSNMCWHGPMVWLGQISAKTSQIWPGCPLPWHGRNESFLGRLQPFLHPKSLGQTSFVSLCSDPVTSRSMRREPAGGRLKQQLTRALSQNTNFAVYCC